MIGFINRFFDPNQRKLNQLKPIVEQINALESEFADKTDEQLTEYSQSLQEKVRNELRSLEKSSSDYSKQEQAVLDKYLPEAFALVREAFRVIGERSYNEQLMVSILLHQGNAAEQKTGEGKTHAAVHAMFLNALTGRGAHLVTVNDYLARRDAEWMGVVYHKLGVSVGCINSNGKSYLVDGSKIQNSKFKVQNWKEVAFGKGEFLREVSRKEVYAADVTYGTNNEFGFDYLRDNMTHSLDQLVQVNVGGEVGVHHFAIVDEVDSILIDEARTPLIISAPAEESNELYKTFAALVEKLNPEDREEIDEKTRTTKLSDLGVKKIEKWVSVDNIYEDFQLAHHLEQALKAQDHYDRDKAYVVKDDQVMIVDEFTGRLMEGRRYSEGLHQAIEAKEGVEIQKESKTVATITFQNYFRMYEKLAGMSATILTEAEEFYKIYKLDSVNVPTHRPMVRKDNADRIYKNQRAKWKAIVDEIAQVQEAGQPILVGTTSVENNELVSQLLKRRGVKHEVLNAKNHQREAEIVSQAGQKGAVTVATNMAGRGTDIKLGEGIKKLGGLHVVGTERHDARRIDNQLRGRSGRQGDPGSSRFFVGLDDNLMRIFGGDRIAGLMTRFNLPDDMPIEHGMVSKSIESAQHKVEGYNFDIRKHLVEYDDVINKQREIIYKRRRRLLDLGASTDDAVEETELEKEFLSKAESVLVTIDEADEPDRTQFDNFKKDFGNKKQLLGPERFHQLVHHILLTTIDHLWMEHIDTLDELRAGIGLRGYGQRDPLVEFKNEAYQLFERHITDIDFETVNRFTQIKITAPEAVTIKREAVLDRARGQHQELNQFAQTKATQQPQSPPPSQTAPSSSAQPTTPYQKSAEAQKLSRNDPCPCGSGKKWKNCGLKNTPEHQENMKQI